MAKKQSRAPAGETWAGAVKAIGLRSLTTGKFWQFGFLAVIVIFAWRIDSPDWVKIAELFLASRFYNSLGWVLFVLTALIATAVHKGQRAFYQGELARRDARRETSKEVPTPQVPANEQRRIE